jgi:hypothetical protein
MFGLIRRTQVGLTVATVAAVTATGFFAWQAPAAEAATAPACYERYVGAPVNEKGIECPGNPSIWKSYTFASDGFGYYTETEDLGGGRTEVRLGYRHRDGRVAISINDCDRSGCVEERWNGVPFPFGH